MRIDKTRRHDRARSKPQCTSGLRRKLAKSCSGFDHAVANACELFTGELAQTDCVKIALVPAVLMREVGPFAGDRAARSRRIAGGAPGQVIGKIEEMPGPCKGLRQVFLEPEQLWRLHFGRNVVADIAQYIVPRCVDPLCLLDGAVIHPHDDVAFGIA